MRSPPHTRRRPGFVDPVASSVRSPQPTSNADDNTDLRDRVLARALLHGAIAELDARPTAQAARVAAAMALTYAERLEIAEAVTLDVGEVQ